MALGTTVLPAVHSAAPGFPFASSSTAHADALEGENECPVLDYEGFYAELKNMGISFPANASEALAGTSGDALPQYELTLDNDKHLYTLKIEDPGM